MADRKMTLRARAHKAVLRIWPGLKSSPWMIKTAADLFIAGWHARGRADRVTKDAIVAAAIQFYWDMDSDDEAIARDELKMIVSRHLERAKGRK